MSRARGTARGRSLKVVVMVLLAAVVVTGCATAIGHAADGAASGDEVQQTGDGEFEIVAQGQNAAVRLPVHTVVTERETWIDAWAALTANQSPMPERPEVSFADSTVVIVVMGERPTGGYSVDIASVLYSDGTATVEVSIERPGEDAMVTQALTTPFVIARLEGPALQVTFVGDDVYEEFSL